MRKRTRVRVFWLGALMLLMLSSGCGSQTHTKIDWVDFLNWNGQQYLGVDNAALRDPSTVGEVIGRVKFQVADQVDDPQYKVKDGDAACWEPGTEIHALADYPAHEFVAVQDAKRTNGYRIYHQKQDKTNWPRQFSDIQRPDIEQVEIVWADTKKEVSREQATELFALLDHAQKQEVSSWDGATQHSLLFESSQSPIAYEYRVLETKDHQFYGFSDGSVLLPEEIGGWLLQTPDDELTTLVTQFLKKDQGVEGPAALEKIVQEDNAYLSYLFRKEGVEYEGLSYATKQTGHWAIQQSDLAKSDMESPVTSHVLSGETQGGMKSQYRIYSGAIHDKRVRTVKIKYPNRGATLLKLGEQQKLYLDVQMNLTGSIESIEGLDAENQEVFVRK